MELDYVLHTIRRWFAAIISVMVVTAVALGFGLRQTKPVYNAQVKLQLTAPQVDDVTLFDQYRSTTLRDQMTVTRNNLIEVLQSREVYTRTLKQLGIQADEAVYSLDIKPVQDSDFIYVTVHAADPKLAEQIANAHTSAAITYYGEVRAKPAGTSLNFLSDQLKVAETRLRATERAFTEFKISNGIGTLENELATYKDLIANLQQERNRQMLEGATSRDIASREKTLDQLRIQRETANAEGNKALTQGLDDTITRYTSELDKLYKTTNSTSHVDEVIAKRRDELQRLIALSPRYNELQENVQQAQANYQLLLNKHTEAMLKENTVKVPSYIQIIEPALAPIKPVPSNRKALFGLGLAGSLGLGLTLAFLLEYIAGKRPLESYTGAGVSA